MLFVAFDGDQNCPAIAMLRFGLSTVRVGLHPNPMASFTGVASFVKLRP